MHRSLLIGATALVAAFAQQPDPPGQAKAGEKPKHEAYLFAHMVHSDYGRLYYTVSRDGLRWTALNAGKRVFQDYRGHPDICVGHDGRYYIVGNRGDSAPDINFWVSSDLITWEKYGDYTPDLKSTPGYGHALQRIGAPKLYFDEPSRQYLLTWHTPHLPGTKTDPERYWASQRTLYAVSRDLKSFEGPPRRLFPWEMGTIDVVVRRIDESYYAIIKDERYPELDWPTGKTIRIAKGESMTGPWSEPGPPISPNFHEAPMLIPSPDGTVWYLYYEEYPGMSYGVSVARKLEGPWYKLSGYTRNPAWNKYALPPDVRHGCMLPISAERYDSLVKAFGGAATESPSASGGVRP
jgi:hypothetical protein